MKPKKFTTIQIRRAMVAAFDHMDKQMWEKTRHGSDVSQEDWDSCSFSYEEIMDLVEKYLVQII